MLKKLDDGDAAYRAAPETSSAIGVPAATAPDVAELSDIARLFDAVFYSERHRDSSASGEAMRLSPWQHYKQDGLAQDAAPCPLFDPVFYRRRVAVPPDMPAILHYIRAGAGEAPSPLFDPDHYEAACAAGGVLIPPGMPLLVHFMSLAPRAAPVPTPLFDGDYYLRCHPDVAQAQIDPFRHFLACGLREGRDPHPLFDTGFYTAQNPDVAASGIEPFLHFLTAGDAEGRAPNPFFEPQTYFESVPDAARLGLPALAHYLRYGRDQGPRCSARFDAGYYLACNPDVAMGRLDPLSHYLAFGRHEGRDPLPRALRDYGWSHVVPTAANRREMLIVMDGADDHPRLHGLLHAIRRLSEDPALTCRMVLIGDGPVRSRLEAILPTLTVQPATSQAAALLASLRTEAVNPIVLATSLATADVAAAARRLGLQLILWTHETPMSVENDPRRVAGMSLFADAAATIVTPSPRLRTMLRTAFAVPEERIAVIPDGAEQRLAPQAVQTARWTLRARYGLPDDCLLVLGGGDVAFRSGTDLFIRIANTLIRDLAPASKIQGALQQAYFLWFGDTVDPLFAALCRQDVVRLGLEERVLLPGPQDDFETVIAGADLVVDTARDSASRMIASQAVSLGVPALAFGLPDEAGAPWKVVPHLDTEAMARSLAAQGDRPARRRRPGARPRSDAGAQASVSASGSGANAAWADWHDRFRNLLEERHGLPPIPVWPAMGGQAERAVG